MAEQVRVVVDAMGNLQNLISNPVEEIPVMSNHNHNALKTSQKVLQPGHHLIIQMVGSSRSSTSQEFTRVLASATLFFCPPDK